MRLKAKTTKQLRTHEAKEVLSVVLKAEEKRKLILWLNAKGWDGALSEYARQALAEKLQRDGATFTISSLHR